MSVRRFSISFLGFVLCALTLHVTNPVPEALAATPKPREATVVRTGHSPRIVVSSSENIKSSKN